MIAQHSEESAKLMDVLKQGSPLKIVRAIGVVLSGTMADGMRGAQIIHDVGGKTIVQDPSDAQFPDMPQHVIRRDHPALIEAADELGNWLSDEIGTLGKP